MTDTSREAFEKWAVDILGDNPNWCESGDCELAWQSWQASSEAEKAQPAATVQCVRGVTIGYLDVMQPVGTKLYTHPAQQVAVPMTEAQIFECDPVPHEMFDRQRIDFARAIEAFHKIGSKPDVRIPTSETKVRPQNCGTGHCSCIECPYPKADWSAA